MGVGDREEVGCQPPAMGGAWLGWGALSRNSGLSAVPGCASAALPNVTGKSSEMNFVGAEHTDVFLVIIP